jgi:hypothetical protein
MARVSIGEGIDMPPGFTAVSLKPEAARALKRLRNVVVTELQNSDRFDPSSGLSEIVLLMAKHSNAIAKALYLEEYGTERQRD